MSWKKFAIATLIIAVVLVLQLRKVSALKIPETATQASVAIVEKTKPATAVHVAPVKAAPNQASRERELKSLTEMTDTLSEYSQGKMHLVDLVSELERTQQAPVVTRDANAYTGEMAIVRTKNPLPGTRYFHAQYFADEHNEPFVQHMSFEFKPGPSAMADALDAVKKSFPQLGSPTETSGDFVEWAVDEHHILWVKKMAQDDLKENPFNAYSSNDIGTIRVAYETEPHGSGESFGESSEE